MSRGADVLLAPAFDFLIGALLGRCVRRFFFAMLRSRVRVGNADALIQFTLGASRGEWQSSIVGS
jgi:hypothetical protein